MLPGMQPCAIPLCERFANCKVTLLLYGLAACFGHCSHQVFTHGLWAADYTFGDDKRFLAALFWYPHLAKK